MLFAHIADTHLGYRQFNLEERELDFYGAWHEAVDLMISEGVDLVVHAGDLFDEPRPPIRALVEAKRGIEKLKKKGIKIVMIPGNHDTLMRRGSMAPHAIFDGVDVLTLDRPSVVVDDVFIGGLPYQSKSYRDVLLEKINALQMEAWNYKRSILLLHQGIDKYLPYEYELSVGELPGGFSYYAFGHIHMRVEDDFAKGTLCYSGSTEMWRTDEVEDWERSGKGFLITDTENIRPRRMNLEGIRPFLKTEIATEADIYSIRKKSKGRRLPVFSLTIASDEDFNFIHDQIREKLSESALYLDVRKKPSIEEEVFITGGALDIEELINEALIEMSEDEKTYTFGAFKELSKNDVEGAIDLTDNFYERWKRGAP
jgi:DNA repair exonuclease SbcCD nuclease subunit